MSGTMILLFTAMRRLFSSYADCHLKLNKSFSYKYPV